MKITVFKTFNTWQDAVCYSINNKFNIDICAMEKQLIEKSIYKEGNYLIIVDEHKILGETTRNV